MFNLHNNVTADGVVITEGLWVFTNDLTVGQVIRDRNEETCCLEEDHPKGQIRLQGWFSDHATNNKLSYPCTTCRHDHWFVIQGQGTYNGERLATVFQGKEAAPQDDDLKNLPFEGKYFRG